MTKTFVVIPSYNEEEIIGEIVTRAKRFAGEVIVVDDSFTKELGKIAEKAGAHILYNDGNKGVGFSRRSGIQEALKSSKGNESKAAKLLNINHHTFRYRKRKLLGD